MKRLLALLAALLMSGAVSIAGATPAQAACSVAGSSYASYTAPNEYHDTATARTDWVDCGPYKRLQHLAVGASSNVDGLQSSTTYGNPSVYWRSGGSNGPVVNGYDAYSYWNVPPDLNVPLGNQRCYDPCHVSFDARFDPIFGAPSTFIKFIYL